MGTAYGYKFTLMDRAKSVVSESWPALITIFLINAIIIGLYGQMPKSDAFNILMIAQAFNIIVAAFATYIYGFRKPTVKYKVRGINFIFVREKYFIDENSMKKQLDDWMRKVDEYLFPLHGVNYFDVLDGVTVIVQDTTPIDHKGAGAIATTDPVARTTVIHGGWITQNAALGYELKLHICHKLFPFREEGDDIKWMREVGW